MKVIDLLNKIANGEEVPLKIKVKGYEYRQSNGQFWCDDTEMYLIDNCTSIYNLNDEVEIIEEDNKIEKIDIRNEKNCKNNWKWKVYGEEHSYNISTPQKIIADKINEIIDYLEENK